MKEIKKLMEELHVVRDKLPAYLPHQKWLRPNMIKHFWN